LRLDVLSRYNESALILDQLYKNYLPMAQTTGTLWENKDTAGSCNHGFASQVAHILYRDILGIHFDPVSKTVEFRIPDIDLDWCEGHIPVGDEWIDAKWVRDGDGVSHTLSVPKGFRTTIVV
jgi:alpha-L-rhamnosidase